jgi:hypothetical protein
MSDTLKGVEVKRLHLKPGDQIVLKTHDRITPQIAADIKASAKRQWPNHEIVVLDRLVEGTTDA